MDDNSKGYIDVTLDGTVRPLNVDGHTIIERSRLAANIVVNLERSVPRFLQSSGLAMRKFSPIAIISGGPSLAEQLDRVREFDVILTCGSVHDYVRRQGIIPTYAVVSDAGVEDKNNLSLAHPDTTFLLASQCDPSLYEHLAGHRVEMWHYAGQVATPEEEAVLLRGERSLTWGGMVTLSSICLALQMGFQHQHFFGFDGNYGEYGLKSHVAPVAGGYEYDKVPFHVPADPEGKLFITNMNLAEQLNQFFRLVESLREWVHFYLYGDGLTTRMVKYGEPELRQFITLAD